MKGVELPRINLGVKEPEQFDHAIITATNNVGYGAPPGYDPGRAGAEMALKVWTKPTDVSFYNVQIMEVGEDATVEGYFADTNKWTTNPGQRLKHGTANFWFDLNPDNSSGDHCWTEDVFSPAWLSGHYTWDIPARWHVKGDNSVTNSMTGWNQVHTIDANGTVTITKFGKTVSRTISNVITNN